MNLKRPRYLVSALSGFVCLAQPAGAFANPSEIWLDRGQQDSPAHVRADPNAAPAPVLLATQSLDVKPRAGGSTRGNAAKSTGGSTGREPSWNPAGGRGSKPVLTAMATGPGQPGYVHYFLLKLPDESLETLVGIELPGRKIAWSFPDLGVVVSPFVEEGVVAAGGKEYGISHLYGIRPFPDDAAMSVLRGELAGRVGRWVAAGTPYCENDGPRSKCMSCLGFVLRVLFPGRHSDFPDMPADFWRTGSPRRYSTEDLLLYLTGMTDLLDREARLRRVGELKLPEALREDVLELVNTMDESAAAPSASAGTPQAAEQKRPAVRPSSKVSTRPAQRKRL